MLKIFRLARFLWLHKVPVLPRLIYVFNRLVFSVVLPPSVAVGRDVHFGYSGLGIVIHARCKIGDRVKIAPLVTLDGRSGPYDVPEVENDVEIGARAKVVGPVRLGWGSKIGANAVVLQDVPAGATVVGIPARIVGRHE
jgi:serine O-acetyltransferase